MGFTEAAQFGEAAGHQRGTRALAEAQTDRDAGGDGEVRVELEPKDYAGLTREMVRFWNEQGEAASQPPVPLKEDEA